MMGTIDGGSVSSDAVILTAHLGSKGECARSYGCDSKICLTVRWGDCSLFFLAHVVHFGGLRPLCLHVWV